MSAPAANSSFPQSQLPPGVDARVRRVELIISTILRAGVIASLSIVVIGIVITFTHHPQYLHSRQPLKALIHPEQHLRPDFPHTLKDLALGLAAFHGEAIVVLGLLLLISTPVIRVAVSIFIFLHQKDRIFTLITIIVLALLLLSFFMGKVEGG